MAERAVVRADTVDLADLVRTMWRGWRVVALCTGLGIAAGLAVMHWAPRRFTGRASAIVRSADPGSSLLSRIGGGVAAGLLPTGPGSTIETEAQVLSSRALAERAVDSLMLQVRVRSPQGLPSVALFQRSALPGSFKPQRLHFERGGAGTYDVSGAATAKAEPGKPTSLLGGTLVLRESGLPARFDIDVLDREEAVTRLIRRLSIGKPGGEIVTVSYAGDDSLTAARVPNLLLSEYLVRRRTSDRGVNTRKVEHLTVQLDSVEQQLRAAERALRRDQEATGIVDPEVVGKLQLEQAGALRQQVGALDIERGALAQLQSMIAAGKLTTRQLAAYPTFLKSSGINELLGQLSTLEAKRVELLSKLTPEDPQVIGLLEATRGIEAQFPLLADAYRASLDKQRADAAQQLDTLRRAIERLPAVGETMLRDQRDVLQLSQVSTALRAQLVEARVGAIAEGGDVRPLDEARPPRKPTFPNAVMTMGVATGAGLIIGVLFAVVFAAYGRFLPDARAIERQLGVPALAMDATSPLLVGGSTQPRSLLLIPLDAAADTAGVAERLMRTAASRELRGTVLDLSHGNGNGSGASSGQIDRLTTEFDLVVVRLPELHSEAAVASLRADRPVLLVASPGRVSRDRLTGAIATLERVAVPCAGVVLSRSPSRQLVSG